MEDGEGSEPTARPVGQARRIVVPLPRDKEQLEAYVASNFAKWLRHEGRDVHELGRPAGEWPDACLEVEGDRVGIELVEVVDQAHRRRRAGDPWYLTELKAALVASGLWGEMAGLDLTLHDGWGELPRPRSARSVQLIEGLVDRASMERDSFIRCAEGVPCGVRHEDGQAASLSLMGVRRSDVAGPARLTWDGGYMVEHGNLFGTVARKIAKNYTTVHGFDQLWLLVWDRSFYLLRSGRDTALSLLNQADHPFDQVWISVLAPLPMSPAGELWPEPSPFVISMTTESDTTEAIVYRF